MPQAKPSGVAGPLVPRDRVYHLLAGGETGSQSGGLWPPAGTIRHDYPDTLP